MSEMNRRDLITALSALAIGGFLTKEGDAAGITMGVTSEGEDKLRCVRVEPPKMPPSETPYTYPVLDLGAFEVKHRPLKFTSAMAALSVVCFQGGLNGALFTEPRYENTDIIVPHRATHIVKGLQADFTEQIVYATITFPDTPKAQAFKKLIDQGVHVNFRLRGVLKGQVENGSFIPTGLSIGSCNAWLFEEHTPNVIELTQDWDQIGSWWRGHHVPAVPRNFP